MSENRSVLPPSAITFVILSPLSEKQLYNKKMSKTAVFPLNTDKIVIAVFAIDIGFMMLYNECYHD